MASRDKQLSDVDIRGLKTAYDALFDARESMLDGLERAGEDSYVKREVVVDGVISGAGRWGQVSPPLGVLPRQISAESVRATTRG